MPVREKKLFVFCEFSKIDQRWSIFFIQSKKRFSVNDQSSARLLWRDDKFFRLVEFEENPSLVQVEE